MYVAVILRNEKLCNIKSVIISLIINFNNGKRKKNKQNDLGS